MRTEKRIMLCKIKKKKFKKILVFNTNFNFFFLSTKFQINRLLLKEIKNINFFFQLKNVYLHETIPTIENRHFPKKEFFQAI